ncbi:phosphatase PAP2 family protein [Shewanella sp. CG12_big_fil_rev_8_21_14_0_65_47_15]|uniref:phosphatase PAP2 family protein n=1 Tax=Shewanella sp. CG12_big_fil_rev_8_21_14_0_65_47_15 TaxID=1975537 RepID=UPI000CC74E5F|nr:phosphatase PAP2 family protein [Shewanella sp. CG12_big_fil_rev_8_21_14_0_65_47_15]PIW58784.1 MAG: PAP2 family protein [Shewanella sp. CG12_big_fil_rev_8_21_14_0_65_47_15]
MKDSYKTTFFSFAKSHLFSPLLVFAVIIFGLEWTHADMKMASILFQWQGGVDSWPLRGYWFTENLLHVAGRNLVILLALVVVLGIVFSFRRDAIRPYRKGLIYLFCSVLASVLLVRIGKNLTHMTCPWDVVEFGGRLMHSSLFARLPEGAEFGQCFPGGHSSGGFAWVATYYVLKQYHPRYAKVGLVFGLLLGVVFGMAQELRGAHFLSHDLWSLAVAWTCASLLYYGFFLRAPKVESVNLAHSVSMINAK